MLLEKDYFDEWMRRLMQKLESMEKSSSARSESLPAPPGERLLDNYDLCRMLNVSKRSLQRYRTAGDLPYQMLYHKTFYKEADVLKFIEKKFNDFHRRCEVQKSSKQQEVA